MILTGHSRPLIVGSQTIWRCADDCLPLVGYVIAHHSESLMVAD